MLHIVTNEIVISYAASEGFSCTDGGGNTYRSGDNVCVNCAELRFHQQLINGRSIDHSGSGMRP